MGREEIQERVGPAVRDEARGGRKDHDGEKRARGADSGESRIT